MKILDLTRDSLLLSLSEPGTEVVHCQTGGALMHSGCPKKRPRWVLFRLPFELLRARRYDWVILPPVHVTWDAGNRTLVRQAKAAMARMMGFPSLARMLRKLLFGGKVRFAVTDYSDSMYPSEFALLCIEPRHYFMLNVPRDLEGRVVGPGATQIHYLPTVIQDPLIDSLIAKRAGEGHHDVFIAGDYHNEQRLKQLEAARMLAEQGYAVCELKEKSFEKFTAGILDSNLCMVGRGLAYHCFRPLEAAAAGAAPVYHYPENETYHDWVDGKNCFLYDPAATPSEIAEFVKSILRQPTRIPVVVHGARALLNSRHRASILAQHILAILHTAN